MADAPHREEIVAKAAREKRLKEGSGRIRQLGEDLNASVHKFNELRERHTNS